MKIIFGIAIILSINTTLIGQDNYPDSLRNFLAFNIGVNDFHMKDERISPFIFSNPLISTNINYCRNSGNYQHNLEFLGSIGTANSPNISKNINQYFLYISYNLLFNLFKTKISKIESTLFIGPGISSLYSHSKFNFLKNMESEAEYTWYWSRSLNFDFLVKFLLSKTNTFSIACTYPLVKLTSRPNYSIGMENNELSSVFLKSLTLGQTEYFWNNLVIMGNMNYESKLWSTIFWKISYKFNYFSIDRPKNMRIYMNIINFGVIWKF